MRSLLLFATASLLFASCSNSGDTAKTFCDTACKSDSFNYVGNDRFESKVSISIKDCAPDSVSWTHGQMAIKRQVPMNDLVNQNIRINRSAISCVIKDTTHAWLTFNDCITGRGFLFKLPFNKMVNISKKLGALTSFDPKFSVEEDLRAYTDRGSIFVMNINTDKEAVMSFKETYDIDFNKIHDHVDSIHVTKKRIWVRLKKDGKDVDLQKAIDL
jgi:hypothetical protein